VRALWLVLLVVGCERVRFRTNIDDSGVVSETGRDTWSIPHRVAGTWKGDAGVEWRAIVVRPKLPHADLVRLARALHHEFPEVFFDIYDDDAELPQLVEAHGNDDALSKTWREAHALGTVAGTVTTVDGGLEIRDVQLFEWRSFGSTKL
jgi:hypothetical protein